MKDWNSRRNRSGLTRNEMIAIISLVVLLFGVAVPYFLNTARTAARQASAGNLQQWGIALNLFLTENDNRLPETGGSEIGNEDALAWYNSLPPYLSQSPFSEMNPKPRPGEASLWIDPTAPEKNGSDPVFTYGMNAWLQPDPAQPSYKIYQIDDPGRVIFLTEILGNSPRIHPTDVQFRHGKKYPDPQSKAHVLFCDGHVELVPKSQLKDNPAGQDPQAPMSKVSWVPFGEALEPR